jgi:hypothetical protein
MKRVGIVQSNYVPWKGYFDLIGRCDEFILLDDAQYTRRDWRNRNRIKTKDGVKWLTIPVVVKGRYHQRIDEVEIADTGWPRTHLRTILQAYAGAPHFGESKEWLEAIYARAQQISRLSHVNRLLLTEICARLGIETTIRWSTDYESQGVKSERLASLCRQAGATEYLSGPSARDYLDEELFARAGITIAYMDYSGYPEYPQPHPPFEHGVSVLDLILSTGPDAPRYLKREETGCPAS